MFFGSPSLYFYFVAFLGQQQAFISGYWRPADGRFGAFWGVLWLKISLTPTQEVL
jgi:hypothetical protein